MPHLNLTSTQFLWFLVSLQLAIFSSIWLLASFTMKSHVAATRMFGLFNLALMASVMLVALRGLSDLEWLTRTGSNLLGLASFVALWAGGGRLYNPDHPMKEPWLVLLIGGGGILLLGAMPGHGHHRVAVEFLAIAWIIIRTLALVTQAMAQRSGWLPMFLTRGLGWVFVAVIVGRASGALLLGWPIEINQDSSDALAFAYFALPYATATNSILAYVLLRTIVAEVELLARHDALTGLFNRRAFDEQQALFWDRWKRQGATFAAICLDIDHFKAVNDQFGHAQGDALLKQIALALQQVVRPTDMLARTGGEEFIVLLDGDDVAEGPLFQFAERLRIAVASAVFMPDRPDQQVTISLGVSRVQATDERPENVITRADLALYQAKREGRNRVVLSTD